MFLLVAGHVRDSHGMTVIIAYNMRLATLYHQVNMQHESRNNMHQMRCSHVQRKNVSSARTCAAQRLRCFGSMTVLGDVVPIDTVINVKRRCAADLASVYAS